MSGEINNIKKRISEEWLKSLPLLSAYNQNKLYRILGCTVNGIELIQIPNLDSYQPYFVIYPLWKEGVQNCLDAPSLNIGLKDGKGLGFKIPYLKNSNFFKDAVDCLKNQEPMLWNDSVSLKTLFQIVDDRFQSSLIGSNSAQQAKLFELKFYCALYTGDQTQVNFVFNQIYKASKNWDIPMFEIWYGNLDSWLEGLYDMVNQRDLLLSQVEANREDIKLSKLNCSEIID